MKFNFIFSLILLCVPLYSQNDWSNLQLKDLNPDVSEIKDFVTYPSAKHGLDLTIVLIRGSVWDLDSIKKHISRVSEVYAQCSIMLGKVTLLTVDPPLGNKYMKGVTDPKSWESNFAVFIEKYYKKKPIIFLLDRNSGIASLDGLGFFDQMAETTPIPFGAKPPASNQSGSWSGNKDLDCAMAGTVWLWKKNKEDRSSLYKDPKFDVMVHELAHVLGDVQTYTNVQDIKNTAPDFSTGKCYSVKKETISNRYITPKNTKLVLSHSPEETDVLDKKQCDDFVGNNCEKGNEKYCARYVYSLPVALK